MSAWLLLLAGCPTPGDDSVGPPVITGTAGLEGTCADADRLGRFTVDSNIDSAFVTGSASNGVVPTAVLTELLVSGDCTIWRRENPFCDPTCDPGDTCDLTGACVPYPETQDLGTVRLDGLLAPVAMTPIAPGYSYFDTSLADPPWAPGALLSLTTGAGYWDPVQLDGVAPAPLAAPSMDWVVVGGQPFSVSWDAPATEVATEVVVELRIDQHGTTPASVVCRFADEGAGEVPASVIDGLMDLGVTGFPTGSVVRRTADHAPLGEGCIDFVASATLLAHVSISGYTPCRNDAECPKGLECNEALERCE